MFRLENGQGTPYALLLIAVVLVLLLGGIGFSFRGNVQFS